MLKWAIIFAVISAISGFLGYSGLAAGSAVLAKGLFILFLILFGIVASLIVFGVTRLGRT